MFGIGETELLIIVAFAFMVFGPDKLPGMGRTIGRALRQFREAQEDFTQVVQAEVVDPLNDAMNEPSARKRAKEAAAAAAAEDADIDDDSVLEMSRRKETFAERKARLQAERAQQESAAADEAGSASAAPDPDDDSDLEEQASSGRLPVATEKNEQSVPTAASLYALTPHRTEDKTPTTESSVSSLGDTEQSDVTLATDGEEAQDVI